jgi:exodeoxyribonuclease VII small subunit
MSPSKPKAAASTADTVAAPAATPPATPASIAEPPQFERAIEELEALVDRLEGEDLTLEASLALFERGIGLTRACEQALDAAEQRVRILTEQSEQAQPEPFPPANGSG